MIYKGQFISFALLLLIAGCTGNPRSASLDSQGSWPAHGFENGARADSFVAVAVDENDRVMDSLTDCLQLAISEHDDLTRVTISASAVAPRASTYVHLEYNQHALRPVATRSVEQPAAQTLFLSVTSQPGTVALGLVTAALRPELAGDFVIAEVDFAPGQEPLRRSSALTVGNAEVTDLTLVGAQTDTLQWHYLNRGDYDQNGLVNISDLTPIGQYFDQSVPLLDDLADKSAAPYPADGNEDRLVTINDMTPIGANFLNQLDEYIIKSASAETGPYSAVGQTVPQSAGTRPAGQYRFTVQLNSPQAQKYYAVFPANDSGEGPQSNAVLFSGPPPVLNPPTNLQVAENAGQLTVSWQAPLTGEVPTGYDLYSAAAPEAFGLGTAALHPSSPISGLSINLNAVDFPPTVDRYFALKSAKDGDRSANFSNITFWDGDEPPAGCPPPLNFSAASNGANIVLSWDPPADTSNLDNYVVFWCSGNPDDQLTFCSPLGVTEENSFVVNNNEDISPDKSAWFSIQARCLDSSSSAQESFPYLP